MGELLLVRHGETEWSRTHKHTGRTDVPLTPYGEGQARALAAVLATRVVVASYTSPLSRAAHTAELAGLPGQVDEDLVEWDNGGYEGRTTAEIRGDRPGWWLWTDGVPTGDTPGEDAAAVGFRCRRVLDRVAGRLQEGDVALFGHGHALRALAAVWLGLAPEQGGLFTLDAASLSTLGHYRDHRVVTSWNDVGHWKDTSRRNDAGHPGSAA